MSMMIRFFFCWALSFCGIACGSEPLSVPARITDKTTQTITLMGIVTDNNGKPLHNVTIALGTSSTFTTLNGTFTLKAQNVKTNGFTLVCQKSGYFTVTKRLIPNSSFMTIVVALPVLEAADIIDYSRNDTVEINKCTLLFAPNSFVNGSNDYKANAQCAVHIIDGQNAGYTFTSDGNGISDDPQSSGFNRTAFSSLGHYRIAVSTMNGTPLSLRSNQTITMLTPVPSVLGSAPADCPLWFYDNESQSWKRKGNAVYDQSQNVYVSSLDRLGTWMLAFEDETGIISGEITCGNAPVKGIVVNAGINVAITDSMGKYSVPAAVGQHIVVVERVFNGGLTAPARTVTIAEKGNQQTMNLQLQRCGVTLNATIVDANDKPLNALTIVQSSDNSFMTTRAVINGKLFMTLPPSLACILTVQTPDGKSAIINTQAADAGSTLTLPKIKIQ